MPATTPTITSLDPAAAAGSPLTLTADGRGFDPSACAIEVRHPDGRLVAASAAARRSSSRVEGEVDLSGVGPGTYEVTVVNPGGARSKPALLTLRPEVEVTPASGRPGTLFTYKGRGFSGGLDAITHLEGPTAVAFQSKRITTTARGTFEQQIDSAEFHPGTFRVWAVDDRTRAEARPARFEIAGLTRGAAPPRD